MTPSTNDNLPALRKLELSTLVEAFRRQETELRGIINAGRWTQFRNGLVLRRIHEIMGRRGGYEAFVREELRLALPTARRYSNFSRTIHHGIPAIAKLSLSDLLQADVLDKLSNDRDFQGAFVAAAQRAHDDMFQAALPPAQRAQEQLPQAAEDEDDQPDVDPVEQRKQDVQAAVQQSEFLWMNDFVPRIERDILGVGITRQTLNGSWMLLPTPARAKLADTLMDAARKIRESLKDGDAIIDTVEVR